MKIIYDDLGEFAEVRLRCENTRHKSMCKYCPFYDRCQIDENEDLTISDEKIKIYHTPGHTKGGVCYFVDDKLFSGDTIFLGSVGRTDLPGGSYESLRNSVRQVLNNLDDNVKIYTGHGDLTTVGYEKQNNPVL